MFSLKALSLKKAAYLALGGMLLLSTVPAISVQMQAPKAKTGMTLQEFVQKHDKITVEYSYPGLQIAAAPADSSVATKVTLPGGSPVVLRLTESIDSNDLTQGATISFTVVNDVKVNDTVVIRAGQLGQAQVVTSESAGRVGQAGKLTISDFSVKAVDGTYIPLRGTLSTNGKEKTVTSGVLAYLICPLFLLMKGGNATLPAGFEKTVFTASDVTVTLK